MSKLELVQYLWALNGLMTAQSAMGGERSQFLKEEYEKHWQMLKNAVAKDNQKDEVVAKRI